VISGQLISTGTYYLVPEPIFVQKALKKPKKPEKLGFYVF